MIRTKDRSPALGTEIQAGIQPAVTVRTGARRSRMTGSGAGSGSGRGASSTAGLLRPGVRMGLCLSVGNPARLAGTGGLSRSQTLSAFQTESCARRVFIVTVWTVHTHFLSVAFSYCLEQYTRSASCRQIQPPSASWPQMLELLPLWVCTIRTLCPLARRPSCSAS